MSVLRGGLMTSSPERPGDDMSEPDATLSLAGTAQSFTKQR
jgi:hypothetical protein